MSFSSLELSGALLRALAEHGYTAPTPIQAAAIPHVLAGRDLLAAAQTGTGKTAAFALPLLERLRPGGKPAPAARRPRVLILTPTRELAAQVHDSLRDYGKHVGVRSTTVFGGVGMGPQVQALARGVDVVVATPGRLIDHLERGSADLRGIEVLVLDEADRMLDMGFLPAIRRILGRLPQSRQTLLFSATFADNIRQLARQFLNDPIEVQVAPPNSVVATVAHRVHPVDAERKRDLLLHLLAGDASQTLVFSRTKHGADKLCKILCKAGLASAAIHGNKSQNQRTRALAQFKSGAIGILVATDIAARGLDIAGLPAVINFDLPHVPEDYVHRIGRTGRAGATGLALSLVAPGEEHLLRDIRRVLKQDIAIELVAGFEPQRPLRLDAPAAKTPSRKPSHHAHANHPGARGAPGSRPRPAKSGRRRKPASRAG
jgi:ATP-dependent RNA helicase RhlE